MATLDTTYYRGTDAYSDGDEAENRILELVKGRKKLSDLETDEVSWPTLYHLSPLRENICNWFPFRPDARILEIGAGCGAVTGALCRTGAEVVSVDLSLRRSTINYERHREYDNLRLVVGNLNDLIPDGSFDYVTLTGVLEYAGRFTEDASPYHAFLRNIRGYLKPDGRLLVAIENRLGLKYFAGAEEDHLGTAFSGLRGYREADGVKTFSRRELQDLLEESGFPHLRFYYPWPDYKFPLEIFTEETLKTQGYGKPYLIYDKERKSLFPEADVAAALARDGAAGSLANSFLVEACLEVPEEDRVLYAKMNTDRREAFRIGTGILEEKGERRVIKYPLCEAAKEHIRRIRENEEKLSESRRVLRGELREEQLEYPWIETENLAGAIERAVSAGNREKILQGIDLLQEQVTAGSRVTAYESEAFRAWFGDGNLQEKETLCADPANVDLMADNLFPEGDGCLLTDCEWVTDFPVPVAFILWRALEAVILKNPKLLAAVPREELFSRCGITEADVSVFRKWNWHFENEYVSPRNHCRFAKPVRQAEIAGTGGDKTGSLLASREGYQREIDRLNREVQEIYSSRSWKLAAASRKISGELLPAGSRRRQYMGRILRAMRHHGQVAGAPTTSALPAETGEARDAAPWEAGERLILRTSETPAVSVVIPVYNQFIYTWECLKSIGEHTKGLLYEVLVADDGSTDETKNIARYVSAIRVIRNERNLGFLRNCNAAAARAKGKYLLLLNNDTRVREDWMWHLVSLMERDETIGMTGAKLVYPDGRLQEAGGIVWRDGSAWNWGHGQNPEAAMFNYVREADYISGAAILIRADLWKQLGGFDETFAPAYYEDTDLAFRVREAGYRVVYQPRSEVIHYEGITNGTDLSVGMKAWQQENRKKFFRKWQKTLETEQEAPGEHEFTARDRSRGKKHILIIDRYVPNYDRDAGGRCAWMYLNLFAEMGFRVTFLGDNFLSPQPYTEMLEQKGIEVLYGEYYRDHWKEWLRDNAGNYEYVYLQRPEISSKYIDLIRAHSDAKIGYFAHDLHHIRMEREYGISGDEAILEEARKWKEMEYDLFRKADVGHVVGSFEQAEMQKAFPNKAIRNIPLYLYDRLPEGIEKDFSKRSGLLYVGGFGHRPNMDAVLWFAREVLPGIRKEMPETVFHIVGGNVPEEIRALESPQIVIHGYVTDEELEALYRTCRMAVVPLRYGAGVKGKVVEANYYQIPLVTTPVGAEGLSLEEDSIVVAKDADEMREAICTLYRNPVRLRELSDHGEAFIRNHFTTERAEQVIRMDFES